MHAQFAEGRPVWRTDAPRSNSALPLLSAFLNAAVGKAMKEACAEYLPREADGKYAPYNTWEAAEKMVIKAMQDAATSSDAHVDIKLMREQIRKHIKNTNRSLRCGAYGKTAEDQKIGDAAK
jgi:hypothetical protein